MPRAGVAAPEQDPSTPANDSIAGLVGGVLTIARDQGRTDLVDRLGEVAGRAGRTETIVCVVGEFKKGKSALINALLGSHVCPVDDDLATTAVTVVRYGDAPAATVRRREDGGLIEEAVPTDEVVEWVMEHDGDGRRPTVELVDVTLPNRFLDRGFVLVDTPGVGGLNAGHAAATLAFLPSADALIFVTDASAELSRAELDFLASARAAGPPILTAVTKVDMYPAWRRIVEIDQGHVQAIGLRESPFGLSSVLRMQAIDRDDTALEDDSGFPSFVEALTGDVVQRARAVADRASATELGWALGQLRDPLAAELAALEHPEEASRIAAELQVARDRLDILSRGDSAWSARLEDEFTSLRTRVDFEFQAEIRRIQRDVNEELEGIDPATSWPEFSRGLQERIATAVRAAFHDATTGAAAIGSAIAAMLADEDVGLSTRESAVSIDVDALWQGDPRFEGRTRANVVAGLGVVAGATVGVEMLGMVGTLLGAAIVGPAVIGVALVFGGKQVIDDRRRKLADRRQQARTFLGDYLEEVRFQVEGRLGSVLDEMQRQMRARFTDRIAELRRTVGASASALENAAVREATERSMRQAELGATIGAIDALVVRSRDLRPGRR